MDSMTTSKFIISATLTFCGIYFFIFKAARRLLERRRVAVQGEMAQAIIVDNATSKDLDGVTYYHPVITFRTASSQAVTVQSQEGSTIKETVGKKLRVRFLSSKPEQFYVAKSFPIMDVLSILAGLLCVALAWYASVAKFS
jgi:hypothetical protein